MIYSNVLLEEHDLQITDDLKISVVTLGESGKGRRLINLPVPEGLTKIEKGLNTDLTIGSTKSRKPRINRGEDTTLYLLIETRRGYTRRGDGTVRVLTKDLNNVEVLAAGNSADGDAGRIGAAAARVLKVLGHVILRVKYGGDSDPEFWLIEPNSTTPVQVIELEHAGLLDDPVIPTDLRSYIEL